MAHICDPGLTIRKSDFGFLANGERADLFTLENSQGITIKITNFGGIITSIIAPDKHGKLADIVLGYDDIQAYEKDPYYLGAIIGRYAGRIEGGKLNIDEEEYALSLNHGNSQLHGGNKALNKQCWQANITSKEQSVSLTLSHTSPDGDNGFPGNVEFKVIYSLNQKNEFTIEYFAQTDKKTIINLTQHSYFNLAGHHSGRIDNHQIELNADYFLPMNAQIYPTGEIRHVAKSAHDFRQLTELQQRIHCQDSQVILAKGFDNYWLNNQDSISQEHFCARAIDPKSGRCLTLYTDQPCVVFYTGNYLDGSQQGKGGYAYLQHDGFCFEPQQVATHKLGASMANTLLSPELPFYSKTRFIFTCL